MLRIGIRNLTGKRIPPVRVLKRAIKKILRIQKRTDGELNLVFVTDARMRSLNLKYRNEDRATDVLAFSMKEGKAIKGSSHILGDIAVSLDTAARQARIFGSSKKKELYLYIIHGILHLLGYDHRNAKESKLMQRKQDRLLGAIWNSIT